jgi:predicted DNA-binding protein
MTNRKKNLQSLYLENDRAALLDELATGTRVPKAVYLREAVDDLLMKYEKLPATKMLRRKSARA